MLIREFIHIHERVNKDDFVLKLTAGVADPETTLGSYVVTKELVQNFDDPVGFIKGGDRFEQESGQLPAQQLRFR